MYFQYWKKRNRFLLFIENFAFEVNINRAIHFESKYYWINALFPSIQKIKKNQYSIHSLYLVIFDVLRWLSKKILLLRQLSFYNIDLNLKKKLLVLSNLDCTPLVSTHPAIPPPIFQITMRKNIFTYGLWKSQITYLTIKCSWIGWLRKRFWNDFSIGRNHSGFCKYCFGIVGIISFH